MPLRLEKRKDSGIWRIRGSHYGVIIDQSARTRSKAEANEIRRRIEAKIFGGVHNIIPKAQTYTFADAVTGWIEGGGKVNPFPYFEIILDALADENLDNITQGLLDRCALKHMPTQSAATRRRHFYTPVSIILNYAAGERMMPLIKITRPKVKKTRPRFLTPHDAEILLDAAGDMKDLLTFFLGTGARTSEIMRLEWKDISIKNERITFWETKSGTPRSVDLGDRTRAVLPPRAAGRVWRTHTGTPWAENNGRFHGPATRLARISTKLGWDRIGLHVLRHSWASWQYAIEPDPLRLMQKGGWQDLSMVKRYAHLGSPDLKAEILKHGWFQNLNAGNIRAETNSLQPRY